MISTKSYWENNRKHPVGASPTRLHVTTVVASSPSQPCPHFAELTHRFEDIPALNNDRLDGWVLRAQAPTLLYCSATVNHEPHPYLYQLWAWATSSSHPRSHERASLSSMPPRPERRGGKRAPCVKARDLQTTGWDVSQPLVTQSRHTSTGVAGLISVYELTFTTAHSCIQIPLICHARIHVGVWLSHSLDKGTPRTRLFISTRLSAAVKISTRLLACETDEPNVGTDRVLAFGGSPSWLRCHRHSSDTLAD